MIFTRLPTTINTYTRDWMSSLVRALETSFRSIHNELDSTFRRTSSGKFGIFYDTTTQTIGTINVEQPVTFDTTDETNGIVLQNTSEVLVVIGGIYNIQSSIQLEKTTAGNAIAHFWLRKNGTTNITSSADKVYVTGSSVPSELSYNYTVLLADMDYLELMWTADTAGVTLNSIAASSPIPAVASAVLAMTQIARL